MHLFKKGQYLILISKAVCTYYIKSLENVIKCYVVITQKTIKITLRLSTVLLYYLLVFFFFSFVLHWEYTEYQLLLPALSTYCSVVSIFLVVITCPFNSCYKILHI